MEFYGVKVFIFLLIIGWFDYCDFILRNKYLFMVENGYFWDYYLNVNYLMCWLNKGLIRCFY